jgi:hypothetical protein
VSEVKLTYETCVYLEQLGALIAEIEGIVQKHVGDIGDVRVRTALAAAALVSVAQNADRLHLDEKFRVNGVSGLMRNIVTKWN